MSNLLTINDTKIPIFSLKNTIFAKKKTEL